MLKPRMEVLPDEQKQLWPELAPTLELGLVLYGGTAIALRLGHRSSVDFDFFSAKPIDRKALEGHLPFLARATTVQEEPHTLSVLVPGSRDTSASVKVSFFGALSFGRVGEPERTEDGVLDVASLDDLMAMKLKVILQRAEAKDYQDIARMIEATVSLEKGLSAARVMFGPAFQPSESLKALTFFEDGTLGALRESERAILRNAAGAVRDLPPVRILSQELAQARGAD